MRIIISVDMEGATGVCHREHLLPGGDDYQNARRWLTGDVNAAVRGAFESGASEVLVADGHGTMRNILLDDLHPNARLLTGPAQPGNRPLAQLGSLDHGRFDAAMLVGHHSRAGTPGGLLAHTWIGMVVQEIRLNGRPASEAMLNMAILGHYGIPVVMASGSDDFCTQMREDFGTKVELAEVKKTLGPTAIVTLPLIEAQDRILEAARNGLESGGMTYIVEPPIRIEVDVHRDAMRERALELGAEPVSRLGFAYEGGDVISVVENIWRTLVHITREDIAFLR
jgi:D-amino peptidase